MKLTTQSINRVVKPILPAGASRLELVNCKRVNSRIAKSTAQRKEKAMKNIIEKFYYGELIPCEKPSPNSEKYKETSALLTQTEEDILRDFPDIRSRLEEYKDILHQLSSLESAYDFCDGFRLGALFMYDILSADGKE